MKAKDTVMGIEIVSPRFPDYIPCAVWDVLEAQAEISFFAGRRDVLDLLRKTNVRAWEELLVYIGGGII